MNKAKAADIEKEMLDGATSIGLKICNQSIWHEEKCNWLGRTIEDISSSPNKNGKMVVFALGPDIYSGTSGISLLVY
jgi:lantibiotic modifying enzyme